MTLTKPRSATRGNSRYHWVPAAAGWTVGVIATLSLLASVSPLIRWIIKVPREFINDYLFNFPDTNFAWSFVLALLAAALTARKRIAWLVLLANMVLAAVVNAAEIAAGGNTAAESFGENLGFAVHVVAIVVLVLGYREFWAKVRRGALFRAAAVWLAGAVVGIVASWGLVELFPGSLAPDERLGYAANRVVGFALADPDLFTGRPHVFLNAIFGLFGAFALIGAAIVLFLSQRADNALTGEDESAIRGLLDLYGKDDSLGYFATRRDKSVVFASSGRACITYRVEVGVCLASGDPVGDHRAWPQAVDAWLRLCQTYGWAPGVMGASSQGAQTYREAGLTALELGDETTSTASRCLGRKSSRSARTDSAVQMCRSSMASRPSGRLTGSAATTFAAARSSTHSSVLSAAAGPSRSRCSGRTRSAWLCATVGNNKNSWAATSKRFSPIPPLRSSTVCRPSSSACTAALHSFSAGVTTIPRAGPMSE